MRKIALIFILLLFISMASALDTSIKVKTLPNYKTSVYVLDSEQVYYLLESFHKTSDSQGIVSVVYSGTKSKLNVRVIVKDAAGTNVVSEKFGPYNAGSAISIQAIQGKLDGNYKEAAPAPVIKNDAPAVNTTANTTANKTIVNNNTANSASLNVNSSNTGNFSSTWLSGFTIDNLNSSTWTILGAILGIAVLAGAFFGGMKFAEHRTGKGHSPVHSDKALEKKLKYTEKELQQAEAEINKLKNRDKIVEMEKKIEDEKRAIERLKKGE